VSLKIEDLSVAYRACAGTCRRGPRQSQHRDGEIMGWRRVRLRQVDLGNSLIFMEGRMKVTAGRWSSTGAPAHFGQPGHEPLRLRAVSIIPQYAMSALTHEEGRPMASDLLKSRGVRFSSVARSSSAASLGRAAGRCPGEYRSNCPVACASASPWSSRPAQPSLLIADEVTLPWTSHQRASARC